MALHLLQYECLRPVVMKSYWIAMLNHGFYSNIEQFLSIHTSCNNNPAAIYKVSNKFWKYFFIRFQNSTKSITFYTFPFWSDWYEDWITISIHLQQRKCLIKSQLFSWKEYECSPMKIVNILSPTIWLFILTFIRTNIEETIKTLPYWRFVK